MGEINCEDTYISTIYPSFNTLKALRIIEPERELSIILAKIDFAINELPYPINEIPLEILIELITSLQRLIELEPKLESLFAGFFSARFDKIIKNVIIDSIFNSGYSGIFFLPNNDSLSKVNTLVGLIYNLNDPLNSNSACTLFVSDSATIQLLRCLKSAQISLLEYINEKPDLENNTDSILTTKLNKTYRKQFKVFQRNDEQYEYIYLKFVLINRLLVLVEENCNPSFKVFDYFYELLLHEFVISISSFCSDLMLIMTHFKKILENVQTDNYRFDEEFTNIRHCLKLIITRLHTKQQDCLKPDKDFSNLLVMYIQTFQNNKFASSAKLACMSNNSSKKTVVKSSQKQNRVDNNNYKYHLAKNPKEPEWVKNFYDMKTNNETLFQSTMETVNKELGANNILNVMVSNCPKRGFRYKVRHLWTRSLTKYRNHRLIDQNCKKCKFVPFHYLCHPNETGIYID